MYDDFSTIDWVRDMALERKRQLRLKEPATSAGGACRRQWRLVNDAWQGWALIFLVGLAAGTFAGWLDIVVDWLTDVKLGICRDVRFANTRAGAPRSPLTSTRSAGVLAESRFLLLDPGAGQ